MATWSAPSGARGGLVSVDPGAYVTELWVKFFREFLRVHASYLDRNWSTPSEHDRGEVIDRVTDRCVGLVVCRGAEAIGLFGPCPFPSLPGVVHVESAARGANFGTKLRETVPTVSGLLHAVETRASGHGRAIDPIASALARRCPGQGSPEAIVQRRVAPVRPGAGVRILVDRVGGSAVSGHPSGIGRGAGVAFGCPVRTMSSRLRRGLASQGGQGGRMPRRGEQGAGGPDAVGRLQATGHPVGVSVSREDYCNE